MTWMFPILVQVSILIEITENDLGWVMEILRLISFSPVGKFLQIHVKLL